MHTGADIEKSAFDKREKWMKSLIDMMGKLETEFQCAGLFESSPIYLFSNMNNGLPKKRCFEDMMAESDAILDSFH